jgi:hypothetical protein
MGRRHQATTATLHGRRLPWVKHLHRDASIWVVGERFCNAVVFFRRYVKARVMHAQRLEDVAL